MLGQHRATDGENDMATRGKTATRRREPQAKVLKFTTPDADAIHGKPLWRNW